jgi:predicted nucleic acid-binding protein
LNLYLDASALVKRYVDEGGSRRVHRIIAESQMVATAVVSRAEVGAALAKAVRLGVLTPEAGQLSVSAFRFEWPAIVRLPITESVAARADSLAWEHGLRGYDAVHLAAALHWADLVDAPVTMATFDRQLWGAAASVGLTLVPEDAP